MSSHCTAESAGAVVRAHVLLAEPEISQHDVPLVIDQDVLGLEVAVDDVVPVQEAEPGPINRRESASESVVPSIASTDQYVVIVDAKNKGESHVRAPAPQGCVYVCVTVLKSTTRRHGAENSSRNDNE